MLRCCYSVFLLSVHSLLSSVVCQLCCFKLYHSKFCYISIYSWLCKWGMQRGFYLPVYAIAHFICPDKSLAQYNSVKMNWNLVKYLLLANLVISMHLPVSVQNLWPCFKKEFLISKTWFVYVKFCSLFFTHLFYFLICVQLTDQLCFYHQTQIVIL